MPDDYQTQQPLSKKSEPTYRLFLGISLNQSVLTYIRAFQRENGHLSTVKWIREENIHITVFFFGNVKVSIIPNLISFLSLALKHTPSFSLTFDKYVWAPSAKSPRMIWLRLFKDDAFRQLVQRIHELYQQIDPHLQQRKSPIPHITLARVKKIEGPLKRRIYPVPVPEKIMVNKLTLWKSELHPNGAIYTQLAQFSLSS